MNIGAKKLITLISVLLSIFVFFIFTSIASASYGEEKPPTPRIMIEKWVWNPASNSFVENLSVNQFLFLPDQDVKFKVEVKNTGDKDLEKVEVTDKLPKEVSFVSGPGSYDKEKHSLTFIIDKLNKGEAKSYELTVKVKKAEDLPSNVFCMSNLAEVRAENMINQDT